MTTTSAIQFVPLSLPASADPSRFTDFGREVVGVDLAQVLLSPGSAEFGIIEEGVYKASPTEVAMLELSFLPCSALA